MDYVLVHGTTQAPAGWQRLTGALTRRGHRVQAVDLPADEPGLLAADYARLAAEQVAGKADEPVVVAHSGGCLLLPAIAREVGARHLVWLAGYVPDPAGGQSFAGEIKASGSEMFGPEWRSLTEPPTADPVVAAYFLFHDCDLETLRWAVSTLRLFFPVAAYQEAGQPAEPVAPSTYVLPRGDRTFRPDWMRAAARERLGVDPVEIDGGHCPHVSRPEAIAEILDR
jgi:pimeloyl-ACP methyl ester carboxylesterase